MDIGVSRRRVPIAGRFEYRNDGIDVGQVGLGLRQARLVSRNRSLDFVALRDQRRDGSDFYHSLQHNVRKKQNVNLLLIFCMLHARASIARFLRRLGAQQRGAQNRELLGGRQWATQDAGRPLGFG
jgi:hypothetical protein